MDILYDLKYAYCKKFIFEHLNHRGFLKLEKELAVSSAKCNNSCADCKQAFPPSVMRFHHVRGQQRIFVSAWKNHSYEDVIKEIENCDIVCTKCINIRIFKRKEVK